MDPIPGDLLKLKVRFDQRRVTRESRSEPVRRSNWPRVVSESTDHFRQAGVMSQISIIYLLLQSRNFIFGGSIMNSTIPADLLDLKSRFENWRTNRKYVRGPIPDEF